MAGSEGETTARVSLCVPERLRIVVVVVSLLVRLFDCQAGNEGT